MPRKGLSMPTDYQGEQTLLVTRPTRLIALRYWTAMVLALIVAGVLFFQVPWRFVSLGNPALAGVPVSSIVAAFFVFLAFLAFVTAELKRRTTRYIITDNKIIREDGILNKNTEMIPYTQLERVDLPDSRPADLEDRDDRRGYGGRRLEHRDGPSPGK